jgi:hypothetical protein
MRWILLILMGCSTADPCAKMCSSATRVYGACLETWDASWTAAGYADARDYFHACETWAWELRLLEREAKRDGEIDALGQVEAVCELREAALMEPNSQCDTWSDIDWETLPW